MNREQATRLLRIVRDQLTLDGADTSSAALRQLGNHEFVVILSNEQCTWHLWSHDDFHALRKRTKAKVEQQRARRKKLREEVSA